MQNYKLFFKETSKNVRVESYNKSSTCTTCTHRRFSKWVAFAKTHFWKWHSLLKRFAQENKMQNTDSSPNVANYRYLKIQLTEATILCWINPYCFRLRNLRQQNSKDANSWSGKGKYWLKMTYAWSVLTFFTSWRQYTDLDWSLGWLKNDWKLRLPDYDLILMPFKFKWRYYWY